MYPAHDETMAMFCGELREAFTYLIAAVESPVFSVLGAGWEIEQARKLLSQDTGRIAEQLWQNTSNISSVCFVLADYIYPQLFGVPRSPSGWIPTESVLRWAVRCK